MMFCNKPQPNAAAFFAKYFAGLDGNTKKMEGNSMKRVIREGAVDAKREEEKAKKIKIVAAEVAANIIGEDSLCPFNVVEKDKKTIGLMIQGMLAAVVVQSHTAGVPDTYPNAIAIDVDNVTLKPRITGGVAECDHALNTLVAEKPLEMKAVLKGMSRNTLTWEHRAAGAFLYLHPSIHGVGDTTSRLTKVSAALGVADRTVAKWFSLHDMNSKANIEKWLPLVKSINWGKVCTFFESSWADAF